MCYVYANRSQKTVLDSLQLGSQVLRSRRIGDRNQTYIFLEGQPVLMDAEPPLQRPLSRLLH